MNKTSIVIDHPCGCVERRWLLGKDNNRRPGCKVHREPAIRAYQWSDHREDSSGNSSEKPKVKSKLEL